MKVIGKRKPYSGGLAGMQGFFEMAIRLRGDQPFVPRGVYRFKTHEEADEWMIKMLTRPKHEHEISRQLGVWGLSA